jgi:hypothetical protein
MAIAEHEPSKLYGRNKSLLGMSHQQLHDFAATPRKGLPVKLTTKTRNKLPASSFAGPGRSYPVEDKSHARNAKARASEMEHKGKISKSEEAHIDARVDKVLGHGGPRFESKHNVQNAHSHAEKMAHS